MENWIIDEIIELTADEKSRQFFEQKFYELREGVFVETWSEAKHLWRTGKIKNLTKYFTAMLKKETTTQGSKNSNNSKKEQNNQPKTHFQKTQLSLFKSFQSELTKEQGPAVESTMEIPYSRNNIPWATFLTPSFFTLSTNKAKSDKVIAKFKTMDGQIREVPIVRGRLNPGGEEYGILTVEHAKVLAALESIWIDQNQKISEWASGAVSCYCDVSISELAKKLGWGNKKLGGKDRKRLQDLVFQMQARPYWLDLNNIGLKNINCSFTLLRNVVRIGKKGRGNKTILSVSFSIPLSEHLAKRHAVSRPKEISRIRGEIAFLLRLHLEPILIGFNGKSYSKSLSGLIDELCLPSARWHTHMGLRKMIFERAVKELNMHKIFDGRPIFVAIEKSQTDNDWMLVARLGAAGNIIEAPAENTDGANRGLSDWMPVIKLGQDVKALLETVSGSN